MNLQRAAMLGVIGVCFAACAARQPIYLAPDLATRGIREIALAPLVEERAFPDTQVPLATYVAEASEHALSQKGYAPAVIASLPVVSLDVPLLEAAAAALPALPARYALWIAAELVETDSSGIGLDTRVRLAGILVDYETNEVLWRDRAERESSISGAGFAVISPSVRTYEAVYLAVGSLLETLPGRAD